MADSHALPLNRLPDSGTSRTIGLLRWVLMFLVVLIHTNLVADTGCEGTLYGQYPLFSFRRFLMSFAYSLSGF